MIASDGTSLTVGKKPFDKRIVSESELVKEGEKVESGAARSKRINLPLSRIIRKAIGAAIAPLRRISCFHLKDTKVEAINQVTLGQGAASFSTR